MSKLKIALPKGRFHNNSLSIVKNNVKDNVFNIEQERKLFFESEDYIFFLLKPSDICSLILNEKVDLGIVPDEWILEHELQHKVSFDKLKKFNWINTRMSLITDSVKNISENDTIVSSYPFITQNYLEQKSSANNRNIYKLSGSIEATIPSFFPFGIDCVESGETIARNNLIELDIIHCNLSLSLIKKNDKNLNLKRMNKLDL
ncbi:ATP phosphoribosyltransferase [Candidatus Peregrinibacteria bacterium]|nr:ATP phosphoribosyltransferase [Candidatus Peregrinibacteria bacterium]